MARIGMYACAVAAGTAGLFLASATLADSLTLPLAIITIASAVIGGALYWRGKDTSVMVFALSGIATILWSAMKNPFDIRWIFFILMVVAAIAWISSMIRESYGRWQDRVLSG